MRPPCSWSPEGHGDLQAGTPARRGHPVSGRAGVPRASPGQRAGRGRLPGGPGRSVLPPRSPAASEGSGQSRLVPGARGSEIRGRPRGRASRRDGAWGPGRAAGGSCSGRAARPGRGCLSPASTRVARASSGTRSRLARGPGGGRRMAALPQREGGDPPTGPPLSACRPRRWRGRPRWSLDAAARSADGCLGARFRPHAAGGPGLRASGDVVVPGLATAPSRVQAALARPFAPTSGRRGSQQKSPLQGSRLTPVRWGRRLLVAWDAFRCSCASVRFHPRVI